MVIFIILIGTYLLNSLSDTHQTNQIKLIPWRHSPWAKRFPKLCVIFILVVIDNHKQRGTDTYDQRCRSLERLEPWEPSRNREVITTPAPIYLSIINDVCYETRVK